MQPIISNLKGSLHSPLLSPRLETAYHSRAFLPQTLTLPSPPRDALLFLLSPPSTPSRWSPRTQFGSAGGGGGGCEELGGAAAGRNSAAPAAAEEDARNWAELPLDAISAVLRKLDHIEILMGAGQVCRSWRRAARDEPALWRRIDMRFHADLFNQVDLHGMAQAAVRRSAGQCEAFWGEYAGDDDFLLFLGDAAPSLKSLHLISCYDVSNEGFAEAIKKLSLLELELSLCKNVCEKDVFETVGKACPHLKRFRLSEHGFYSFEDSEYNKDGVAMGIATMTELRSLQLFGNTLTNEGLTAILDNCPHLESLDIRHCFNVNMDDTLRAKCARIKTLRLPHDSTDDYEFQVQNPVWADSSDDSEDLYGDYMGSAFYYDLDSENYDDYCDPSRYLHGVYEDELDEESRMILRGMRALLK